MNWMLALATVIALLTMYRIRERWSLQSTFSTIKNTAQNLWNGSQASRPIGPPPAPTDVVFYTDANFQGKSFNFALGSKVPSLNNKLNDSFSSVVVPKNVQVTLYADSNYGGRFVTLHSGSFRNLGIFNFNDMVSSFTVDTEGGTWNPAVKVFTDKNFKGKAMTYYGVSNWGFFSNDYDNKISSMIVMPGYKVTFYADIGWKGEAGVFTFGDYPYVGDYWNDRISSIKIEPSTA